MPARSLIAACIGILAGCAADDVGRETVDVDALPMLGVVEELSIGSVNDPAIGFSNIGNVNVAPGGAVFVADRRALEIRAYDRDGRLIRRIGGAGEGPGEFALISGSGLAGDTVWVSDRRMQRITLFDTAGTLLATIPARRVMLVDTDQTRIGLYPSALGADGLFDSEAQLFGVPDSTLIPRVRFDTSGAIVDTVGYDLYRQPLETRFPIGPNYIPMTRPLPVTHMSVGSAGDSVHVDMTVPETGEPSSFSVVRVRGARDTVFASELRYVPLAMDDSYIESIAGPVFRISGVDADALRRAVTEFFADPPYHMPVARIEIGADGKIWLLREDFRGAPQRWILIEPDGTVRGRLELPGNVRVKWHGADEVWAVRTDELDVPWLVRYRITG